MIFTFDTNILSYELKGNVNIVSNRVKAIKNGDLMVINPITYYEMYRGLLRKHSSKQITVFLKYCESFGICEMTTRTFTKAAELHTNLTLKGELIEDADIFIAAICIVNDITLITNNEKHFKRIKGLKILNWTI
ncbi:hypothetical protein FACS1894105_01730 [Clostridia bacterium]|nr:hypothetical protein FACS1894105_01730 [Clostridia bacterium]